MDLNGIRGVSPGNNESRAVVVAQGSRKKLIGQPGSFYIIYEVGDMFSDGLVFNMPMTPETLEYSYPNQLQ